jgi:hypothetical protein
MPQADEIGGRKVQKPAIGFGGQGSHDARLGWIYRGIAIDGDGVNSGLGISAEIQDRLREIIGELCRLGGEKDDRIGLLGHGGFHRGID